MFGGLGRTRGTGVGARGGMGFGFRGISPPWPYVGRGGLPRCGYILGTPPAAPKMSREEELNNLKKQAQAVKENLERINARVHDLESEV